jgi:hypothetical protein
MFKYFLLSSIFVFGFSFQADAYCVAKWINEDFYSLDPYGSLPDGVRINETINIPDGIKLLMFSGGGYHEYVSFYLYFPLSDEDGSPHLKGDHAMKNPDELGFDVNNILSKYIVRDYYHHPKPLAWDFLYINCTRNIIWVDYIAESSIFKSKNLFSLFNRPSSGCFAFSVNLNIFSYWEYIDVSFNNVLKSKSSLVDIFPSSRYAHISLGYNDSVDLSLSSGTESFNKISLDFGWQLALKNNIPTSQLVVSSVLSPDDDGYSQAYSAASWTSPQCILRPLSVGGSLSDRFFSFLRGFF